MSTYFATFTIAISLAWLANAPASTLGLRTRFEDPRGRVASLAVAAAAVLILTSALRWQVGTDYWAYSQHYFSYVASSPTDLGPFDEPGLPLLAKLGAFLVDDYATMFALAATITVSLFVITIWRLSPFFALGLTLFLLLGTWQGSFNGVRQYLAASIVFAAQGAILHRKFGLYLSAVLTAALFHRSALVCLLFYFVPQRRLRPVGVGILAFSSVAMFYAESFALDLIGQAFDKSAAVASSYAIEMVHPLRVGLAFLPLALALILGSASLDRVDYYYVNMAAVNAGIWIAASGSAYLARFAIYTGMFLLIGIPRLVVATPPRLRLLYCGSLLAAYAAFWYLDTAAVQELANFHWLSERVQ